MAGVYQFDPMNSNPQNKQDKSFFADQNMYNYEDERPQDRLEAAPAITPSQPKRTSKDIINEIFSYTPPKPTYDPNRPEEIKRRMKLNALGQGFSVLGDMLSLGKGGNVVARPKDTTNDQLQKYIYDYTDRAAKVNDEWNYNNYMAKVKKGLTELDQLNTEGKMDFDRTKQTYEMAKDARDFGLKEDQAKATNELKKATQEATQSWREAQLALQQGNLELAKQRLDEAIRHNQAAEAKETGSKNKDFIYTNSGQPIELREDEKYQILNLVLSNTPVNQADLDLLKPKLGEPVSTNAINLLVQKYAPKVPAIVDYFKQTRGININPVQTPSIQTPQVPQDTTKPKKVPLLFQ
jgi:hypothetical protein